MELKFAKGKAVAVLRGRGYLLVCEYGDGGAAAGTVVLKGYEQPLR